MKYGLSNEQLKEIKDILASYEEIEEAVLFGSRAIDTFKEASDVDIAIKGEKADLSLAAKLKDHFEEETYLPFFFDIVAYNTIKSEDLKKHIDTKGKVLFRRGNGEWREIEISKIIDIANTGLDAIKRAPIVDYDSGIKCMRIQDISQNKSFPHWGFTEVENKNYERFQLKKNDIIIARTGATVGVNKFIYSDLKSVFNNGLIRIRTKRKECLSKFLYYHFCTDNYKNFIESISGGTSSQPNIQINVLLSYYIKLPPPPEQKAIASVLSCLDDKIDLLHRQNKTLESLAETLFRQWFIEEAQEDWEVGELSEIVQFINGKSRPKVEGNYPIYGGNGILGYANKFNAEEESVVIGRVGAYCGSLYFENQKIWVSDNAILGKAKNCIYLYFIFYFLKSINVNDLVEGSSHPMLTQTLLNKIKIQLPSNVVLEKFNLQIEIYFRKKEENDKQIRTLEKLRDTLLPKLMSGDVRVEY